jgi:hypothetical protein
MKKLILVFLISQKICFAQNFDQRSFLDLNRFANEVQAGLTSCAQAQGTNLSQLYVQKVSSCDDSIRQSLRNLKDSFKLFTLSSLVDYYEKSENKEKISPLLIQIISENISHFKLNETKKEGGNRGIGICTGFISIGSCSETPEREVSPVINSEHMAYLRLFDMIPESQCDLGLFPSATVTLLNEIAEAQGVRGNRVQNNVIYMQGGFVMGPRVQEMNNNRASSQLLNQLGNKFSASCNLSPQSYSATDFFTVLSNIR